MSGSEKKVNRNTIRHSSYKTCNQEVSGSFTLQLCKTTAKTYEKKAKKRKKVVFGQLEKKCANLECFPFVWKSRKFREEFKWNGSFLWKFSGQKVIPFVVFPFFPVVTETTEIFCTICLDYQYQASSREKAKKLFVFCEWQKSIPFLFSVPEKKIPVPFDGSFSPKFPHKW